MELWDLVFAFLGLGLALLQSFSSTLLGMFALDILYGKIVTSEKKANYRVSPLSVCLEPQEREVLNLPTM